MARYSGYEGRNVYTEEFWYPFLSVAQRTAVDTLLSLSVVGIPYIPVVAFEPLLEIAGWQGDTYYGDCWRHIMGLRKGTVEIEGVEIEVYFWGLRWMLNLVRYQLDPRSNLFYAVTRLYPNSPIPFHWRSNDWVPYL